MTMKSTSSTRSLLTNGGNNGSRSASPLASSPSMSRMSPTGKKSRRSMTDTKSNSNTPSMPPNVAYGYNPVPDPMMINNGAPTPEMMFQLQQIQHQQLQQQHLVTYGGYPNTPLHAPPALNVGYAAAYLPTPGPPRMYPMDISSTRVSNDTAELTQRIEKKDQIIDQLGSFLTQIKQESEGTASAWKEKIQEIAEYKQQIEKLTQQLRESREKEQMTNDQLVQVTEDVELAVQGLKESEARHLEELKIMNEEIQRRQSDHEHIKIGYEESLRQVSSELFDCQQKLQEVSTKATQLTETYEQSDMNGRQIAMEYEQYKKEMHHTLGLNQERMTVLENEKQELGKHLWSLTQALEQSKGIEQQLHHRVEDMSKEMEQSRTTWSERFHQMQSEKADFLSMQSMLQSQIRGLEEALQQERCEKEAFNHQIMTELQHSNAATEALQQQHNTSLAQVEAEKERWKEDVEEYQRQVKSMEKKSNQLRYEMEGMEKRLQEVMEENERLQQTKSEKTSTLEEMNEKLRQTLEEYAHLQTQYDQVYHQWEQVHGNVLKCMALVPRGEVEQEAIFPDSILHVLESFHSQTLMIEQVKLSMHRIQQDRDTETDRVRQREHELNQKIHKLETELESALKDARTLAQELAISTQQQDGKESKWTNQIQQLTKEMEEIRMNTGLQVLQLQKSLESQKNRTIQLENEKKELLAEAEHLNQSMEGLYQTKNEKQMELEQIRAVWKALEMEHADLKETHQELETNYHHTMETMSSKIKEVQAQYQAMETRKTQLEQEHQSCPDLRMKLQSEIELLHQQLNSEQTRLKEKEQEHYILLEEKGKQLIEMNTLLHQLRSRNEQLEQSRVTEEQGLRMELDKYQQQIVVLTQEKKRVEVGYTTLKTQHEQMMQEVYTLKETQRQTSQTQIEMDEERQLLQSELARCKSDLDRITRAKSSLQVEVARITDEHQDVIRQLEVLRRDTRVHEKQYQDEMERLRKEMDDSRHESNESNAMIEELQTKMTSVQTAANATIQELMQEIESIQETKGFELNRLQKENELFKLQCKRMEDESRRKDMDVHEIQTLYRQEQESIAQKEKEWMMKITRLSTALETKKQDMDKLQKELDMKQTKVAEYERKWNPLVSLRDNLQAKCIELKQGLDLKTRDMHEMEERMRDEVSKVSKEKREIETLYLTMKEDYELTRSQSTGQQQQWHGEIRTLKQTLERTKAELVKANSEVLSMAQRLETFQVGANETISELTARLQGADQQREMAVNALQREINLERERRREAEVQKMELQRLLRQRTPCPDEVINTAPVSTETPSNQIAPINQLPITQLPPPSVPESNITKNPADYRKFYANEPMSNTELANLPMSLIKAQIGLEFAGKSTKSPTKASRPAPNHKPESSNNEDIPALPLEKLPVQNSEKDRSEDSPTCDTGGSSDRTISGKRSFLVSLSARSNSDRYLAGMIDSNRTAKNHSSPSPSSNSKKKMQANQKKKRSSGLPASAATAAAYTGFSNLSTSSPPKMKSNSKLLPRIQQ